MADINAIARQFTEFYYSTFDADRSRLGALYRQHSMLTWEGTPIQGGQNIVEKITSLPFTKVVHKITAIDAQPSSLTVPNLLVSVVGLLVIDDGENPLQFTQVFHLIQDGEGYYVFNDIFRLNLA